MIAPAIMRFGTDEQRKYYAPKIWSGEITCALGYSEPDAGTDLASLKTRAVRDGDDYVINGQKIWTSGAHMSSHVWLATRTDPEAPKHRGISVFIVPLTTPGITIRPIWVMSGARTNEVFYENVRVPKSALIGEENRGWYIIANALDHERVTVGIDDFIDLIQMWDGFMAYVEATRPDVLSDQVARRRLAELKLDLHAHRGLLLSNASIVATGETPTMEASMVKIWGSELRHRLTDTMTDLLGRSGLLNYESADDPIVGRIEQQYRYAPVVRFAGGTNEVQRNIIAQRGLGLPR
jgi:alkylation response protein AidB-like acyl-CoA dehydrogenase